MTHPGLASNTEPILWLTMDDKLNARRFHRSHIGPDGKRILERLPQRGHQGPYDNYSLARGMRSIRMARNDGHTTDMPLTNGAAHLDTNQTYAGYQLAKARYFGWFPVAKCPLACVVSGEIDPLSLLCRDQVDEQPCKPGPHITDENPCVHAVREIEARRLARVVETNEIEEKFVDPNEKLIRAQREQTAAIVQALTGRTEGTPTVTPELVAMVQIMVEQAMAKIGVRPPDPEPPTTPQPIGPMDPEPPAVPSKGKSK